MKRLQQTIKSKSAAATKSAMAQFIVTAYQGLMLAIFLTILISHGEAL